MELEAGATAVVTGASSGIGAALAHRFADAGMNVVLADVDEAGLASVAAEVAAKGVDALVVRTDVSQADEVTALATAAVEQFGRIHVVCNNAGVAPMGDPWMGPLSTWEWVIGVNLWGVVHGIRAFLPHLVLGGGGHIVNTASIAGLFPGFDPIYDATKHAVVGLSEGLYNQVRMAGLPVGVSVLCPGWVNTGIADADRNWPDRLGARPEHTPASAIMRPHLARALAEGVTPAAVADLVATSIEEDRYWVFPHPDWMGMVTQRWDQITEGMNPEPPAQVPGMPPMEQIVAEIQASLTGEIEA